MKMRLFLAYVVGVSLGAVIGFYAQPPAVVCPDRSTEQLVSVDHDAELIAEAGTMLRRNEGVRSTVYTDPAGNPTIGVGFNLTRPDALERLEHLTTRVRYSQPSRMSAVLTPAQITELLDWDIRDSLVDLRGLLPRFDTLPRRAQLTLIDLRYNCGPAGLRTFVNTLKDVHAGRYEDAARRLAGSQWASQVGARAHRTIAMLRGGK